MTTTDTHTATVPPAAPKETRKDFLGLYFPADLKAKVAAAAAAEERSMSQFVTRIFRDYFAAKGQ